MSKNQGQLISDLGFFTPVTVNGTVAIGIQLTNPADSSGIGSVYVDDLTAE